MGIQILIAKMDAMELEIVELKRLIETEKRLSALLDEVLRFYTRVATQQSAEIKNLKRSIKRWEDSIVEATAMRDRVERLLSEVLKAPTEATVLAAARALYAEDETYEETNGASHEGFAWESLDPHVQARYFDRARAALDAFLTLARRAAI